MHAKTSVVDGRWVRVGSTDFNMLGVAINYELDALVEDPTLFPARPQDVADAIAAVLSDPGAAAERARRAKARVQRYSTAAVAREYTQVYRDVSARSRGLRARMS